LALLYLLLLIPEREPPAPSGAGRQPFAWNQNAYWSELERLFIQARNAGCETLTDRIDAAVSDSQRLLDDISAKPLPPEDAAFTTLENHLFQLAPLMAACPQRLPDYSALLTRTRAQAKHQSQHWEMNAPPTRQRLYRLLSGTRLALEEVMLQAPAGVDLPQLTLCDNEPSGTPAADLLGVTLHSGDILVSRGGAPTSALIARGNDYPGSFSHVALVHVDDKTGRACVIESHIERGVAVASFEAYLKDRKLRIMVLRLRADLPTLKADPLLPHKAASLALEAPGRHHIPYDFALNYRDHRAQFCSEVVSAAYEQVGLNLWMGLSFVSSPTVTAWLASLGARNFETQEPADLEYDPQLRVVAEWRDRATLFKAHADDAVTDVMLAEAKPGVGLDYRDLLLPFARAAKAYSAVLNLCGKVGPVPEGMSATTALRVKKYRHEHAAIVARLLALADDFQSKRGYAPPYWELVRLARQAKHDFENTP